MKKSTKSLKRTPLRKKTKSKTNSWYRQKAVEFAKLIAKHRDNYRCVKCGKSAEQGYQIHGSHIFPEGKYHAMSFLTENIKALCARCHMDWHENPLDTGWFIEKFPDRYKKLKKMSISNDKPDYKKAYEELKEKVAKILQ